MLFHQYIFVPAVRPTTQAIGFMLLSMVAFAAMNIVIRHIGDSLHSTQMVFVRNVISLFLVTCVAAMMQRAIRRFRTDRLTGHAGRAMAGLLAMQLWFYSVTIMPVTFATALSFTTPIFATIFAIVFLKEKAGWRRWSALAVSFGGVLLILNPDPDALNIAVLYVLAASAAMAVAGVFVKSLSRTESPETIVFFMALFMTPASLPFALGHWQPMDMTQLGWLFLIAFFSTSAQLMMAHAFRRTTMVMLMPLDFTRLIFTSLFAYIAFGEVLEGQAWAGAGLIVASSVYIAHREATLQRIRNQKRN